MFEDDRWNAERRKHLWTEATNNSGVPTGYGTGWFVFDSCVQHPGGTVGGSVLLRVYPCEKIVIVLMANLSMLGFGIGDYPDLLFECLTSSSTNRD